MVSMRKYSGRYIPLPARVADSTFALALSHSATVDTWPEAFFVVGASTFTLTLLCLLFVRVRRPSWNGYSTDNIDDEEHIPGDILTT